MAKKEIKITVAECTCERCGFAWTAKTANPKLCPRCKSAGWNEEKKQPKREAN